MGLAKHFIPFCIALKKKINYSIFIYNIFYTFVTISLSLAKR